MTAVLKKALTVLKLGLVIIGSWVICIVMYAVFMALVHVNSAQAAVPLTHASTLSIQNQDQIRVQWSTKNVNTVAVSHETIDQVIGNSNQYMVKRDASGQVYITLIETVKPFSIFFRTNKNHHFSVMIHPNATLIGGSTRLIRFSSKPIRSSARRNPHNRTKPLSVTSILNGFTKGKIPGMATLIPTTSITPISLTKTVRLTPERTWKVGHRIVRVFILQNDGRKPFYFEAKQFHDKGMIVVKPQQNPVPPKSATWLFEIVKG